jgi:hypothetical protein
MAALIHSWVSIVRDIARDYENATMQVVQRTYRPYTVGSH